MPNTDLFIREEEYADLNEETIVSHLSAAVQCETTSYVDTTKIKYEEFDKLHQLMQQFFPTVFQIGQFEKVGYSVLVKIDGSNPSLKPALFMSHMDVVPVVKGTEKDWLHGPFSGDVADGYIWGRGTLDIKEQVFATLEAAEYLLSHNQRPARTIYLAFGQDEETVQTGAYAIAQLLKSRGVELEFLLDEGGGNITDAAVYGAPGVKASTIALYEKGYADIQFAVKSTGGHSSRPFYGTSLGHLAKAICDVVDHPFEPLLPQTVFDALAILKPYITEEPMKTYVADPKQYEKELIAYWLSQPGLFNQIVTTIAPTMITEGSQAGNVMPQNMEAVINFRLAPQDTVESVVNHCKAVVDEDVEVSVVNANDASRPSSADNYGYRKMVESLSHYYKDIVFVPSLSVGSTDARNYECICDCCMRRSPFYEEAEINAQGVHGTNERISIRAYMQGIRVLLHFMTNTCM